MDDPNVVALNYVITHGDSIDYSEAEPLCRDEPGFRLTVEDRKARFELKEHHASEELAARAGLKTRQSVHDWRRKGRIVGWQNARRGYVFPAAQLDERDRPLAGLDRVSGLFADGYAAWVWLTTPRPSLEGATPLAILTRGEVERVAEAAQGDRQGDFA